MPQSQSTTTPEEEPKPSTAMAIFKTLAGIAFLASAVTTFVNNGDESEFPRRRLTMVVGDSVPSYMNHVMKDLKDRKKLFDETPPEEVKYWFEYTGPLQKYFYRFSKSRGKADYFEGRDDSGVTSSRFTEDYFGGEDFANFYEDKTESAAQMRLLENCLAMGSPSRPDTSSPVWKEWFAKEGKETAEDRCRILFTLNTVGAGRGTTMIWETNPPAKNAHGPEQWTSEQETAATHLQRNFEEINSMCATGLVAARVQVLVCEPISAKWTEWMDSLLPNCGGQLSDLEKISLGTAKVEERPSPVQVVVVASSKTADTCHNLKSGFMEKRVQDLVLAPPFLGDAKKSKAGNPSVKTTHPDLISSDDHDLYVGLKWTSLVTLRTIGSFLQASADLAAAASSPVNQKAPAQETNADGKIVVLSNSPSSPFLIPSFVRVSYVSEENAKVAKWRMHGDFFHPAAWEICKDSFSVAWIDHSLSGSGGVNGLCDGDSAAQMKSRLEGGDGTSKGNCGQWWVYLTEVQMPTSPEVYANEVTESIVQGGNNQFWMVTERQRREIVKREVCVHEAGDKGSNDCPAPPQAVIPLGDLESFLVNFTPNTALGKKHVHGRRPGYSREKEREHEREMVRERKQLKGQDDIEKALFDYTIYPAALFRKDATLKAARARDVILTKDRNEEAVGPQTVKSSYYDVTITKPRPPVLGWCQAIARKGLCVLYADYFRTSNDLRCLEACGMDKNWAPLENEAQ
eukprot:CAMPEP_0113607150 /NCGR_PEP_ID=MMETSP0017_2-20120614/3230_1 /TAXON_ID=2856 /ORGANISM="Cylindrotheca closterium" /LENGTH=740 /DNA_ID=CAMNT_0000515733 /DNA_START=110 /DNA_END=2332 /DNA_ORIENTATION=- /assembly_acc=CAM_ASM_000147